jgi:hypothetical protein
MTNLCILRVAMPPASLAGEAPVLLDRVGGGSGGEAAGHEVVLRVIHVFRASSSIHLLPWFSLPSCSKVPGRGFTLRLYYGKHARACADCRQSVIAGITSFLQLSFLARFGFACPLVYEKQKRVCGKAWSDRGRTKQESCQR